MPDNNIEWGQGGVNNSNDWGKAKANSTNNFGAVYDSSPSGDTNIAGGQPVVSITYSASAFCADASDPTPTIQNNAGAGTFSSTTGLVFISTSTGEVDIDASTVGSYLITYTDTDAATATFNLTINALPTVIVSVSAGTICDGESTILTASGASSYVWNDGNTDNPRTVSPTTTTTFTATGTDSNGCTNTGATTITVNALPTVEISGTLTYCAGSTTTLTATAGLSSYLWSTGATTQAINVTAGSYTVTGTDSNGCSATSSASTVVEYPLPTVSISGTLEFCAGQSTVLTATAGLSSYLWSNGETTQDITVTSGGSYSVTGTDSNGCSNNDTVSVTEHALPTVSISGTLSFCAGANTILTASGASTYLWSTGETTASITVSTGGSYSVTGTDSNGCSALDSASVTEYSLPSVSISGTLSYCAGIGASTTLDAGAGFASYLWSTGETTQTISATAGNYTVTVTDSNGCSNTSAQVTVTETPLDVATVTYSAASYCQMPTGALAVDGYYPLYSTESAAQAESSDGTAHAHTLSGTTYYMPNDGVIIYHGTYSLTTPAPTITGETGTFSESTGNLSIDSSTGVITLNSSTAGTYTVVYTTNGTCPNTVNNTITINVLDGATFAYSSNSLPQTGTASLTTTPTTSGGVYSAYPSGLSINSSTGEIDLAASTIQSYKIFYETSGAGCPNSSTFDLAVTAAYSPLLDTYTGAKIAYSLRKLDSNYTGNAIRVRRSSDNSEQDIGFTNNELDTTSLLSFVGSNDGYVTTWYDQSGNSNNATHSTAINQPLIVSSGVVNTINSKPSIKFNGSVKLSIANNNFGQANSTPYTILTVANMTSLPSDTATNGGSHIFGIGSASNGYFTTYGDKIGFAYNGGSPVTNYTSGRPSQQILQDTNVISLNSTQLSIYTRGSGTNTLSSNNNTPVTNTQTANPYPYSQAAIGASSGNNSGGSGVSTLIGNISECILWWTNFNSDRTDIKNNLNSFYTIY